MLPCNYKIRRVYMLGNKNWIPILYPLDILVREFSMWTLSPGFDYQKGNQVIGSY